MTVKSYNGAVQIQPGVTGVGIVLKKHLELRVREYIYYDERIILLRMETKPRHTIIVHVYMPTNGHETDKTHKTYDDDLEEIVGRAKDGFYHIGRMWIPL